MKKVILLIITVVGVLTIIPIRGFSQNITDFFFQEKQIHTLTDGKNQTETYQIQRYDKNTVYLVYTLSIKHQTIRTISLKLQFQKSCITSEFIRIAGINGNMNQKNKTTVLALPGKKGYNYWTNQTSSERLVYSCKYVTLTLNGQHTYKALQVTRKSFDLSSNKSVVPDEISYYIKGMGLILKTDGKNILSYSTTLDYKPDQIEIK
ncbi:hypothetical protein [uncultured Sanguibacteroides sp.]|uniref:hypothetical protein n=1 Tax=uncultured Sanguibacteroides sp. TaxID=1635151 RepID=UPI0025EADBB7|nr:hypothetical protein [uncultured Sanguibacteroides sp.]